MSNEAQARAFAAYLKERRIVVADPSPSSRSNLYTVLTDLGAKGANIMMASTYQDAEGMIAKIRPEIVVCEYTLENRCGLDLMQNQRAQHPDSRKSLFILVTANASQSSVAKAAEEDVDGYILKPFTATTLKQTLMKYAIAKLQPSPYVQKIEEGKLALSESRFEDALSMFESAKPLHQAPSLACFYMGKVHMALAAIPVAETHFAQGLKFNEIHYKCLVGLYDVLHQQKRHSEAYNLVKRLTSNFPANSDRIVAAVRLAILSQQYDDVETYYHLYTKLDERSDEVIRYMCAALVVTGKYFIKQRNLGRGLDFLRKAAISAAGRTKILQEIIVSLIESGLENESPDFLKRFPADQMGSAIFKGMELLIFDRTGGSPSLALDRARKFINEGVEDPWIYHVGIKRAAEAKLSTLLEEFMFKGCTKYPEMKAKYEALAAAAQAPKT